MNLSALLEQLETAQLVRRADEGELAYQFKHALTQDAAYQSLLLKQRREVHRHVAQAYEAVYSDRCLDDFAAVLALHYTEAGDDEHALIYAKRAGDLAAQLYANAEAIAFYTQALDAAKRNNATTAEFVHLYTKRGRVLEVMGRNPEALTTYQEMTEFARVRGDRSFELQALLLQGKMRSVPSLTFDRTKAIELATEAEQLATAIGDREAQARILWTRLIMHYFSGEISDAIRYGEQAMALARELDARELLGYVLGDLGRAYMNAGQMERMTALQDESRAIWSALDNKPMLADNLMTSATRTLLLGDYDQTFALTEEGIKISRAIDSKLSLLSNQGIRMYPYLDRGEIDQSLQTANEIVRVTVELSLSFNGPLAYAHVAWIHGVIGSYQRGEDFAQTAREELKRPVAEFFGAWSWVILANFYLTWGKLDAAQEALAAAHVEDTLHNNSPAGMFGYIAFGSYLCARGELVRAAELMAERISTLRQLGFRHSMHDALFIQAKARRGLGQTERAFELLQQARTVAEELQSRRLLWQIYAMSSEIEMDRGNSSQAGTCRAQAVEVIRYIVAHTPPEYRQAFLNLPEVRAVTLA